MPDVHFTLRLPDDLHAYFTQKAKAEDRSLNGQLIHALRAVRDADLGSADPALTARALADPPRD
jgi:hypothetical protein